MVVKAPICSGTIALPIKQFVMFMISYLAHDSVFQCVYLRAGSEINNSPDDPMKRLYAMKMDPNSANSPSHVIVFQDHTDATNLCYLLESHFEAIGDFRTDIVPLPIKVDECLLLTLLTCHDYFCVHSF